MENPSFSETVGRTWIIISYKKLSKVINKFVLNICTRLSGNDYRIVALSESYLTVIGSIMQI